MANDLNATVYLNTVWGSVTGVSEAMSTVEKGTIDALSAGTTKGMKKGAQKAFPQLQSAVEKLHEAGLKKTATATRKEYQKLAQERTRAAKNLAALELQMRSKNLKIEEKRHHQERVKYLRREMKMKEQHQDKLLKQAQRQAMRQEQQQSRQQSQGFGGGGGGGMTYGPTADELGAGTGGPKTRKFKKINAKGGKAIGRAGAVMGRALMGAGAAVGALGAVAGMFAKAYGQTKEMNKEIMSTQTAMDMGVRNAGQLHDTLKQYRKAVIKTAAATRSSKEEIVQWTGAFNEAGMTMQEFKMQMRGAVSTAQILEEQVGIMKMGMYTLGASASEIGEITNTMFKDLGGTTKELMGAFSQMAEEASKSGMRTKDFFAAINQSSSGMALYNFRLGDTISLFSDMVDILGEDMAKTQLGLTGKFRQMSEEDRLGSAIKAGTGNVRAIQRADFMGSNQEFGKKYGHLLTSGSWLGASGLVIGQGGVADAAVGGAEAARGSLTAHDIETMDTWRGTGGGGLDIDQLGAMSRKDFRKLIQDIRGSGTSMDQQAARDLQDLYELARSGTGQGSVTTGMSSLSRQGEMATNLSAAYGVLGNAPLSSYEGMGAMQFEAVTGISGDEFHTLKKLDEGLRGKYEQLVRVGGDEADAIRNEDGSYMRFVDAVSSGALNEDPAWAEAQLDKMTKDQQIANQQLIETKEITNTLKGKIAGGLEYLNSNVQFIGRLVGLSTGRSNLVEEKSKSDQHVRRLEKMLEDEQAAQAAYIKEESEANRVPDAERIEQSDVVQRNLSTQLRFHRLMSEAISMGKSTSYGGFGNMTYNPGGGVEASSTDLEAHEMFSPAAQYAFNAMGKGQIMEQIASTASANRDAIAFGEGDTTGTLYNQGQVLTSLETGAIYSPFKSVSGFTSAEGGGAYNTGGILGANAGLGWGASGGLAQGYHGDEFNRYLPMVDALDEIIAMETKSLLAGEQESEDEISAIDKVREDIVKALNDQEKTAEARALLRLAQNQGAKSRDLRGMFADGRPKAAAIGSFFKASGGGYSQDEVDRMNALGITFSSLQSARMADGLRKGSGDSLQLVQANDFGMIDGKLVNFRSEDLIAGLPSGALSRIVGGGGGGGPMIGTVVINGDPATVWRAMDSWAKARGLDKARTY